MTTTLKRCKTCGRWLPADAEHFTRTKRCRSGVCSPCRDCAHVYNHAWYYAHRAEISAKARERRAQQPPKPRPPRQPKVRPRRPLSAEQQRLIQLRVAGLKECSRCHVAKPATTAHFHQSKQHAAGLHPACKECRAADRRERLRADPTIGDRERARRRRDREENPDKYRERWRQWVAEHREEHNARARAYHRAHPDVARAANRNRKARKKNAKGRHTAADIDRQRRRQHDRCYWCGEPLGRNPHVDHVTPLVQGGTNTPDNLVIACASCNLSKREKLPHEWASAPVLRLC